VAQQAFIGADPSAGVIALTAADFVL